MTAEIAADHEIATVWVTAAGAPERLVWQGQRFRVVGEPIPWVERVAWWDSSALVPADEARGLLEQSMWQVQVQALDTGEIVILDLAVMAGPQWPVTAVFD